jgi:archaeal flagellar protein FlaJ
VIGIAAIRYLTKKFPNLSENLRKANILYSDEEFVRRTLLSALYVTIGIEFILFLLLARSVDVGTLLMVTLIAFPLFFIVLFFYFFQLPVVKISKIDREINKEIVYAGRFLVVELQSGVTLHDAMKNLGKSYPVVGAYFREIVDKISIGTPIEEAVTEAIESSPSSSLTKLMWQVSNSLRTGSDVAEPLNTVVETLIREQQIQVNEYGRKLNPLAMFYMLIAIIIPSLGVTMLTIISIFAGLNLSLSILLIIAGLIGFMQFMFVAMVNSIRPPVEL